MQEARQQEATTSESNLTLISSAKIVQEESTTATMVSFVMTKLSNGLARVIRFVEVHNERDD